MGINRSHGFAVAVFFATFILLYLCNHQALSSGLFPIDDAFYLNSLPIGESLDFKNFIAFFFFQSRPVYHPLTDLSIMADLALSGGLPGRALPLMRLMNLFYLSLSAVTVFFLIEARKGWASVAALAALLFALHPLHAIPTLWISSRKDVLLALFLLLTVWLHGRGKILAALFAFTLALLSKQAAYGLLLWILGTEIVNGYLWHMERQALWPRLKSRVLPYFIIALVLMSWSISHSYQVRTFSVHPGKAFGLLAFYLGKIIWPWPVTVYYPLPKSLPVFLVVLVFFLLSLSVAWLLSRRLRRPELLPILNFALLAVAIIFPYMSLIPNHLLVTNAYAFALVAPVILLLSHSLLIFAKSRGSQVGLTALGFMLLVFYCRTDLGLAQEMNQPERLFARNAEVFPEDYESRCRWAQILESKGRWAEAESAYRAALDLQRGRANETYISALEGLLQIAASRNQTQLAAQVDTIAAQDESPVYCEKIAETVVKQALPATHFLSQCLVRHGDPTQKAMNQARDQEAQLSLAEELKKHGEYGRAMRTFQWALRLGIAKDGEISSRAFEGMLAICLMERNIEELKSLVALASKAGDPGFCERLKSGIARNHLLEAVPLEACASKTLTP